MELSTKQAFILDVFLEANARLIRLLRENDIKSNESPEFAKKVIDAFNEYKSTEVLRDEILVEIKKITEAMKEEEVKK